MSAACLDTRPARGPVVRRASDRIHRNSGSRPRSPASRPTPRSFVRVWSIGVSTEGDRGLPQFGARVPAAGHILVKASGEMETCDRGGRQG